MAGVDLSGMPDQLPDMLAGQTINFDVSGVVAEGGLKNVVWDLIDALASRRYDLDIIGDTVLNRDGRYWYFKAPSLPEDRTLSFNFTAYSNALDEQGDRYTDTKIITVLVIAGDGEVIADSVNQTNLNVGDSVSFDATGSTSGNGDIVKYVWRQTEGPLLEIDNYSPVLNFEMPSFDNADIGVYANDLKPGLPVPTPNNVIIPNGLKNHFDFEYKGAFRVDAPAGSEGNISFSPAIIGVNQENTSIFVSGTNGTMAEMIIPNNLGFSEDTASLPIASVAQNFFNVKATATVGSFPTYIMNGAITFGGSLIVTCESWYDGSVGNPWNMHFASDAYDLANSVHKGYLSLDGLAKAAGFMSEMPDDIKTELGSPYLSGWGSNYSIDGRYSMGPSLYTFDPEDIVSPTVNPGDSIPSQVYLSYTLNNMVSEGANTRSKEPNDTVWGLMASAHFGFIVPNTRKYIVLGSHAGLEGGTGYKIYQEDGGTGGGTAGDAPYLTGDEYSYFWVYDLDDILNAANEYDPKPMSYGKFMLPYAVDGEKNQIRGGAWNAATNTLYLTLSAALEHQYIAAPIILAFNVTAKTVESEYPEIPNQVSFDLDVYDEMYYPDRALSSFALNSGPGSGGEIMFPNGWGRKASLTIQNTQVSGITVLTDFPLFVGVDNLPSESIDAGSNSALNGGGDIRFSSDADGLNQLPCEIVEFIPSAVAGNRKCQIWVKADVNATADTTIYIWYSKAGEVQPDVTDVYGRNAVWTNYHFVLHLSELSGDFINSTGDSNYDATLTSETGVTRGQYINNFSAALLDATLLSTDQIVIYPAGQGVASITDEKSASTIQAIVTRATSASGPSLIMEIGDSVGQSLYYRTNPDTLHFGMKDVTANELDSITTLPDNSGAFFLHGVYKDSGIKLYINGGLDVQGGFGATLSANSGGAGFGSGRSNTDGAIGNSEPWDGAISELRMTDIALSSDFLSTEYNNQSSPGSFLVAGLPEDVSVGANYSGTATSTNTALTTASGQKTSTGTATSASADDTTTTASFKTGLGNVTSINTASTAKTGLAIMLGTVISLNVAATTTTGTKSEPVTGTATSSNTATATTTGDKTGLGTATSNNTSTTIADGVQSGAGAGSATSTNTATTATTGSKSGLGLVSSVNGYLITLQSNTIMLGTATSSNTSESTVIGLSENNATGTLTSTSTSQTITVWNKIGLGGIDSANTTATTTTATTDREGTLTSANTSSAIVVGANTAVPVIIRSVEMTRAIDGSLFIANPHEVRNISTAYQNNDININVVITDNGEAVSMVSITAAQYVIVSKDKSQTYITKSLGSGIVKGSDQLVISLSQADTSDLLDIYYHELQITSDGKHATVFAEHINFIDTVI